jgi:hypothetical protein
MSEIWLPVTGWKECYEVSNTGKVRSIDTRRYTGKVLKQTLDKDGYAHVGLHNTGIYKTYKVHRLVAKEFKLNPDALPQVNHKNLNKSDNYFDNLEWVTNMENVQHAKENNRTFGIYNPNKAWVYSKEKVEEIITLRNSGLTYKQIGLQLGLASPRNILQNKTSIAVEVMARLTVKKRVVIPIETRKKVSLMLSSGVDKKTIMRECKVNRYYIVDMQRGRLKT